MGPMLTRLSASLHQQRQWAIELAVQGRLGIPEILVLDGFQECSGFI